MELFASMNDYRVDGLGVYLDTPPSKKDDFKLNYQDPARRKEAYLDEYAHNNQLASWSTVTEALHMCGLLQEADVVKMTYVQGMYPQSSLSHDIHKCIMSTSVALSHHVVYDVVFVIILKFAHVCVNCPSVS